LEVEVELLGFLRSLAGGTEKVKVTVLEKSKPKILTIIRILGERFGCEFERSVVGSNPLGNHKAALILKNGVEIGVLKGLETPVSNGDKLTLIPVSHGG
jgi:molybdopterin converting factor small subunit